MPRFHLDAQAGAEEPATGKNRLERVAGRLLLLLAFFVPVFFIPSSVFPFQGGKSLFISLAVIAAFSLWVIARLKDGEFELPQSPLLVALGGLVVLSILSGLLSGSLAESFVGRGFEV